MTTKTTSTETEAHWREQAELALAYANSRPASDLNGYCDAMRDRQWFIENAERAANGLTAAAQPTPRPRQITVREDLRVAAVDDRKF
ncbi:hypothetical protein [Xanthobacter sp.]|uniref:hypothetical protein n=1 Tax=Xanthobacter sp. TaxID=35809 RepID=UPI0025E403B9|nr:hypothetical protein [Xanthobacter sp.]